MTALTRPLATLAAAALGGAGLWLAGHWDMETNGGYWAMLGVAALAGMLIALAQLRSPDANVPGMLAVWIPITVAAGWVLVFAQPASNTFRDHIRSWSADLGIADVSHYLTPFTAVLALGVGLVFGLTLLTSWARRDAQAAVVTETDRAPMPVAARTHQPGAQAPVVATARTHAPGTTAAAPAARESDDRSEERTLLLVP